MQQESIDCACSCGASISRSNLALRFWAKVEKSDGCWLWTASRHRNGYGKIGAGPAGAGTLLAHRVAWELAYGPIPKGLFVCHACDVRHCVRPDHLFIGTNRDNMRDATAKGRPLGHAGRPERAARGERNGTHTHPEKVTRGESHATSKLTDNQVREIRAAYATGVHIAQIARAHGVSWSNVKFIVNGTHWKHLL